MNEIRLLKINKYKYFGQRSTATVGLWCAILHIHIPSLLLFTCLWVLERQAFVEELKPVITIISVTLASSKKVTCSSKSYFAEPFL